MKPFILLPFAIGTTALPAKVQVEADFPGGSVVVEELDEKVRMLRFRPMNHKGKGWACWWYFKVSGLTPGKVWKGKKMPGQMGNKRISTKGLTVERIDTDRNLLFLKGAVPGGANGYILIQTT